MSQDAQATIKPWFGRRIR